MSLLLANQGAGQQALLEGAATCTGIAAGALTTAITFAGAATGSTNAAAQLTTEIRLAGAAICSCSAAGDLTVPQQALLEGAAFCTCSVSADLTAGTQKEEERFGFGLGLPREVKRGPVLLEGSARCTCRASGELSDSCVNVDLDEELMMLMLAAYEAEVV